MLHVYVAFTHIYIYMYIDAAVLECVLYYRYGSVPFLNDCGEIYRYPIRYYFYIFINNAYQAIIRELGSGVVRVQIIYITVTVKSHSLVLVPVDYLMYTFRGFRCLIICALFIISSSV